MDSRNISVSELFAVARGHSKYTRAYGDRNPGHVPVYSASLSGPMTHIANADFTGKYLTFTTNGYGGTVQILDGEFAINADRAVLVPHADARLPDYRYLARVLEQAFRPLAVGRVGDKGRNEFTKLPPKLALQATIPLLVDDVGDDDFSAMEQFGEAAERADVLQRNLKAREEQLSSTNIVLDVGASTEIQLGDTNLFGLDIGKRVLNSELTGDGNVPVYSANARKPMGYLPAARKADTFDKPVLIWGIDGLFDWNLIESGSPFVPTDHCGILRVHDANIDPEYLLHALRATSDAPGFDRVFRANKRNVAELTVQIPTGPDGSFDLNRQRKLAKKYRAVNQAADDLRVKLSALTDVIVTPKI